MADQLLPPVPPHSDADTWDLTENALRQLADRRSRWLGDPLTAITMLASLIDQADRDDLRRPSPFSYGSGSRLITAAKSA
jgi:hypothetical protein